MATVEIGIGMVTLTYNADGQRVIKDSPSGYTGYLYDHKRLLQETDEAGEITNTYASGTSEEFGDLIGEDDGMVHQYDAQADTNALLDNTGQVEAVQVHGVRAGVCGERIGGAVERGGLVEPAAGTDEPHDGRWPEALLPGHGDGMYLLGGGANGRYYDTATCRFMSEDPKRQEGGDNNLYAYVHNNPVNHLDPSGHDDNTDQDKKNQQQQQRSTPVNQKSNLAQGSSNPANSSSAGGKDEARRAGSRQRLGHRQEGGRPRQPAPATGTTSAAGTAHSTGTTVSDKTTVNQQAQSARTPVSQRASFHRATPLTPVAMIRRARGVRAISRVTTPKPNRRTPTATRCTPATTPTGQRRRFQGGMAPGQVLTMNCRRERTPAGMTMARPPRSRSGRQTRPLQRHAHGGQ